MNPATRWLAWLLVLVAAAPASAAATVEELIEQLSAPSTQVRQQAEKTLDDRGVDALPAIRKALAAQPPLETMRRLERLLVAGLSKPKRIHLQAKEQTLREIVAALAKQSGYPMTLERGGLGEMWSHDLDLKGVTFWEALDAVCAKGLSYTLDEEKGAFTLKFSDKHAPFVHRHGPFRLTAHSLAHDNSRSSVVGFGAVARDEAVDPERLRPNEERRLTLTLQLECEPHVPLVGIGAVQVDEAADDRKESLALGEPTHWRSRRHGTGREVDRTPYLIGQADFKFTPPLDARLLGPAPEAKKLKHIKGSVTVYLEKSRRSSVLVKDLQKAAGAKFQLGGETVKIEKVIPADDGDYAVFLSMASNHLEQYEGAAAELLVAVDEKGNLYQPRRYRVCHHVDDTVHVRLDFIPEPAKVAPGPPVQLLLIQREIVEYPVPFQFKDLPLP